MKEGYYQIEIISVHNRNGLHKTANKGRTSGTVTVKNSKYSKNKKINKKIKKHLASVRFRIKIAIKCLKL